MLFYELSFTIYVFFYNFCFLLFFRLTLTLSCAMNFATYPHDTQTCSLQMESCKSYVPNFYLLEEILQRYPIFSCPDVINPPIIIPKKHTKIKKIRMSRQGRKPPRQRKNKEAPFLKEKCLTDGAECDGE